MNRRARGGRPDVRAVNFLLVAEPLKHRLQTDLNRARKDRDKARTLVLSTTISELKNREIEKRAPLDEAEALRVVQALVKQREDSAEQFEKAGRTDLVEKERAEIAVLAAYLPQEVSAEAVDAAVDQAIAETGAASAKDMGKVMKAALAVLSASGRSVDGKKVNEAVRRRLAG